MQEALKPCFLLGIVIGFSKVVPYSLETKKFQLKTPGLSKICLSLIKHLLDVHQSRSLCLLAMALYRLKFPCIRDRLNQLGSVSREKMGIIS